MSATVARIHRPVRLTLMLICLFCLSPTAGRSAEALASELDLNKIKVLDLETAVKITLAANPSIAAAQARVEQAAYAIQQAKSSYWPTVDVSAGASWVDMSRATVNGNEASLKYFNYVDSMLNYLNSPFVGDPALNIHNPNAFSSNLPTTIKDNRMYYSTGATATWVIFAGFARYMAVAASRYGEESSIAAHEDVQRSLVTTTIQTYLNAQLARENIAIAKADAGFNNRLLTEARLRYDVGAGALSDVLNFEVLGNMSENSIIQSELDFENALLGLAQLMGVSEGRLPGHIQLSAFESTPEKAVASLEVDQLIRQALEQRSDVRQLELAIKIAEASVKMSKADYYPKLVATANLEGQRPDNTGFHHDDFGSTVAVGLSWNLFSGGITRAKVGESRAKVYELQRTLESAKLNVAGEVQRVVAQIQLVQKQVALQEATTGLVQQQRDLVEKEYKSGVGALVRLNEAQKQLNEARIRLAQSRLALSLARYNLQSITGTILSQFQTP